VKVRYIASACVVVEHGGVRVLCDPWLTDGGYYGSWYHYPPLRFVPEDFADVECLYISHVHPDHLDPETLKRLPKSIPVLILEYADKFVLRILEGLGFKRIIEIPHGGRHNLAPDFFVELYAADNCDPTLCGKFMSCALPQPYTRTMWIDSLALFHGGGRTVVNANDCPYALARAVCDVMLARHASVDFAMVGYSGAGEYPQCFDNLNENEKVEKAEAKRAQFLAQAGQYLTHLRPSACMPFAGKYTLGGRLSGLNALRGVPELEEATADLRRRLEREHQQAMVVLLNSGESFDVESGLASAPYTPQSPVEKQRYVDDVLSKKKFMYETEHHVFERDRVDMTPRLQEAHKRLVRYQGKWGYRSAWKVYLDTGQENLYCIPFDESAVVRTARGMEQEPFVRISLDYSLLAMILDRKAHWNNAAIGSHLRFFRRPDVYERAVYELLSFLHC
jgi:UDP-MurNAc hydroxylase